MDMTSSGHIQPIYRIITESYNPLYVTMETFVWYGLIMQAAGRLKANREMLVSSLI